MKREKISTEELARRLAGAKLLTLDVDGVLTDGALHYFEDGTETRVFHVRDGLGIKMLLGSGFPVAMISASKTPSISIRGKNLGIPHVHIGVEDKVGVLNGLCAKVGAEPSEVIHVGDDLNDIPILERVGFPLTVPNAVREVIDRAIYVTGKPGGTGAIREICELILKARGAWPY